MNTPREFATMPRYGRLGAQRTLEPLLDGECQPPVTPRPRFKLKRRHVSEHLTAPTQQFLASVAAADVPIPSIEEPAIADLEYSESLPPWSDLERMEDDSQNDNGGLEPSCGRKKLATPPRTPALEDPPSLTPSRYPNWNIDWMSDCESSPELESRPSTSQSKRTSRSSFSQLSFCFSDEDISSFSPDLAAPEKDFELNLIETQHGGLPPQTTGMSRTARKAPWTKAMGAHLWATYNMYLSDPRVTPFQIGKSGLPPEGVCKRVAREAARSWKGAKAVVAKSATVSDAKSGSSTPTAESSGAFMQWPHTSAATRAHLRILCKQKARGPDAGKFRFAYFSRSPTPFTTTTARWVRRSTPGATAPPFETHDMSTSLAISTSEAMNPEGPLARLTNSAPESPAAPKSAPIDNTPLLMADIEPSSEERRRLGSPISAKSYGPSSSATLADVFDLQAGAGERQMRTVGPRPRLQSPVRLSRSSTQKRKTGQAHEARKRPSLSTDIWRDPISARNMECHAAAHKKSFSLDYRDDNNIFASRCHTQLFVDTARATTLQQPAAAPEALPQRLGSPFSGSGSSFSVPNRFSQPVDFDSSVFGRRFSTLHPALNSRPNEPASINLASKLAYIDSRLKDFNSPGGCR